MKSTVADIEALWKRACLAPRAPQAGADAFGI